MGIWLIYTKNAMARSGAKRYLVGNGRFPLSGRPNLYFSDPRLLQRILL